jgi:TonB family protein
MSPVSLLFSSDEEAARQVVQALRELELEVETCPDIFTVVEWLTSRSFDVIVADWDSGPEAAFLLKNARELKLNKAAFTLALTGGTSKRATGDDGPDLVLTKPLIPDQIKYALLTNDRFLGCMKAWIARGDFAHAEEPAPSLETNEGRHAQLEQPSRAPLHNRPAEPSPPLRYTYSEVGAPLSLTFATLDRKLFRSLNQRSHNNHLSGHSRKYGRNKFLWGSVLSVAFISAGYIFGQPLQVQSVFASVATVYKQALKTKFSRRRSPEGVPSTDSGALAQAATSQASGSRRYPSSRLQPVPVHVLTLPDQVPAAPGGTLEADARPDQDRLAAVGSRVQIPESLQVPQPRPTAIRTVSVNRTPSLLSQVEPVSLSENLSQALLLDKVQPSYPEQALKAGLQGAVVLQAWIGRDGSIRDLKLVDGSLLLGQAAVKAVKQWRYKPYLRNGVAVEAETYVTVNFRLP